MRVTITAAVVSAMLGIAAMDASAQTRFNVGLLLGSTTATDEGSVSQFDRDTTYQATAAWPVWRTAAANVSISGPARHERRWHRIRRRRRRARRALPGIPR